MFSFSNLEGYLQQEFFLHGIPKKKIKLKFSYLTFINEVTCIANIKRLI